MSDRWNRCDYCGRFIGLNEFAAGTAVRSLLTPDSHRSRETYETFHMQCTYNAFLAEGSKKWNSK